MTLKELIVPRANSLNFILTAITMEKKLYTEYDNIICTDKSNTCTHDYVHVPILQLSKKSVLAPDKMSYTFMRTISKIKSFLSYSNLLQLLSF